LCGDLSALDLRVDDLAQADLVVVPVGVELELADMPPAVKPEEVRLAEQVMGTFAGEVEFDTYRDDYQVGLREIIDAKIEGREVTAPEIEAPPKVVNLMDALRKSLDAICATARKPAPVQAEGSPAARKRARA